MFLLAFFGAALLTVPLCGGRLTALAELRLRGTTVVLGALAVQIVIIELVPGGGGWVHEAIHLATYAMVGVFAWLNRRVPGLLVAATGGAANFAAIAANRGVMPAHPDALRVAGLEATPGEFENSAAVDHPRLQVLGDVFAIPASWPLNNVFSVGDVLLAAGVLLGLHVVCGTWPARRLGVHPVAVEAVRAVRTGTGEVLVRVSTVAHRGMAAGDLLVEAGAVSARLSPLPGSGSTAAYAVPEALLADPDRRLHLALPNRAVLDLTHLLAGGHPSIPRPRAATAAGASPMQSSHRRG